MFKKIKILFLFTALFFVTGFTTVTGATEELQDLAGANLKFYKPNDSFIGGGFSIKDYYSGPIIFFNYKGIIKTVNYYTPESIFNSSLQPTNATSTLNLDQTDDFTARIDTDRTGYVTTRTHRDTSWEKIGDNLQSIALGSKDAIYYVKDNGIIYKCSTEDSNGIYFDTDKNYGNAYNAPDAKIKQTIAAGEDGTLWYIKTDGQGIAQRNYATGQTSNLSIPNLGSTVKIRAIAAKGLKDNFYMIFVDNANNLFIRNNDSQWYSAKVSNVENVAIGNEGTAGVAKKDPLTENLQFFIALKNNWKTTLTKITSIQQYDETEVSRQDLAATNTEITRIADAARIAEAARITESAKFAELANNAEKKATIATSVAGAAGGAVLLGAAGAGIAYAVKKNNDAEKAMIDEQERAEKSMAKFKAGKYQKLALNQFLYDLGMDPLDRLKPDALKTTFNEIEARLKDQNDAGLYTKYAEALYKLMEEANGNKLNPKGYDFAKQLLENLKTTFINHAIAFDSEQIEVYFLLCVNNKLPFPTDSRQLQNNMSNARDALQNNDKVLAKKIADTPVGFFRTIGGYLFGNREIPANLVTQGLAAIK